MNYEDRWLLPEGVDEILPESANNIELSRRKLIDLYRNWGYELVIPPMIEYTDSLLIGLGKDIDLLTFRLTDQLSGRMLGVRADITPQIARMDAHSFKREGVSRLCYSGHVLHTKPKTALATRSPIQVGVELFGSSTLGSDIEVVSLLLESLQLLQMPELNIDLGHVAIYRAIVKACGISELDEAHFFELLQKKAVTEINSWVTANIEDPQHQQWLMALPNLAGGEEVFAKARRLFGGQFVEIEAALAELEQIAKVVKQRFSLVNLYFDLSEVRGYHYHTGIVFAAFAKGFGDAIARGGRYDDIGKVFGRARPAIGFTIDLTTVYQMMQLTDCSDIAVWAPYSEDPQQWQFVQRLRAEGRKVVTALDENDRPDSSCQDSIVFENNQYQVNTTR